MIAGLVGAGLPVLAVLGLGTLLAVAAARQYGFWGNPVSAFLGSWLPMGAVLATGWLDHGLRPVFLWVVACSTAAFLAGCLASAFPRPAGVRPEEVPPVALDHRRFRLLLWGTGLAALAGFLGFVAAVRLQVGWGGLFHRQLALRAAMGQGLFADPTKLLQYATILFPVLVVIGHEAGVPLGAGRWAGAVLAAASNLFSTGRTKVVWVLMWLGFCLILSREGRERGRLWLVALLMLFSSLAVFGGMEAWQGKKTPDKALAQFAADVPEALQWLGSEFYYLGTNLPYLQEIVAEPASGPLPFSNLLLPYVKTLGYAFPGLPVPEEILEVRQLPFPANTGTWLVQFALDAGVTGVLVFPFLIGLLAGWLVTNPAWGDTDPFRLYFGGLMLFLIWIGFIGNKFLSTPTWLFTGFGLLALPWVRRHPAVPAGERAGRPPVAASPARGKPPGP